MLRRTVNMSVRPNNVPFNVGGGGVDSSHQRCQKSRNRRESLTYGITNEIQLLTGYCGQMRLNLSHERIGRGHEVDPCRTLLMWWLNLRFERIARGWEIGLRKALLFGMAQSSLEIIGRWG